MRSRPNPVEALALLTRLTDEGERRANFRQVITALGQSTTVEGPPPLDGLAPEVLSRAVALALATNLVDDLSWIAPGPAAAALYELTAALPPGQVRRDLGRRVFARLYEGTASTFATVAARMALTTTKPFEAATVRARIGLVFDLPIGCSVSADALALTIVTRPDLRERWVDRAKTGTLPARRLAAKLIEHAAREAVLRAQQGDQHPRDLLLGEPIRTIFTTLLADREPLVWRHAAVARGFLAAVDGSTREEIALSLDPALTPTEWRRAAVSLVTTMVSEPDPALRACNKLIKSQLVTQDPGILATMVLGLPRVVEMEPDAAEQLLDTLSTTRRSDVAEAVAALITNVASTKIGSRAAGVLRSTLVSRAQSQNAVLRAVTDRAVRMLGREEDDDSELVASVRKALLAYESKGARAAYELATTALATAHRAMDFIATHDPEDEQVLPYVLGALADLDAGALESPRLSDLLLLGRRPGDLDSNVPEMERLYNRLGTWILDAEARVAEIQQSTGSQVGEQRRLKPLLHLVDLDAARSDDDLGVRSRVRRSVKAMIRRVAARPDGSVQRIACATLARSFDAAVREGVCEPSDLFLAVASQIEDTTSIETINEASTNPDVRGVMSAYVSFLNPEQSDADAAADAHFEMRLGATEDVTRVAERVTRLSRGLGAGGSYRGEALRRVVQRLGRALESVASARGQAELIDNSGSGNDVLGELELAIDDLRRLITGANRRIFEAEPAAITVATEAASLVSTLVERAVRASNPANPQELLAAINELVLDLPSALSSTISKVLERLPQLPIAAASDVFAIPLERRRAALPDWLMPRRTIGAFYVVRALGSGGASSVFMARRIEERNSQRAEGFALKVPDYDPTTARSISEQEFLQLFREEAGALLGLPHHPNLARFVTFDLAARPKPILVMELIRGLGLDRLIRSHSLTIRGAFSYLDGILAGLQAMHSVGVGHLDLKPSNVILRDGQTPVLVDFGLSGRHLRPGCGTLNYCAPEILGVVPAGYASSPLPADIYAFACMTFESLTGQVLFDADDEMAILSAHVSHDGWPEKLVTLSGIPEYTDLAMVLAACMRHDPRERPNVGQVRAALAEVGATLQDRSWPIVLEDAPEQRNAEMSA